MDYWFEDGPTADRFKDLVMRVSYLTSSDGQDILKEIRHPSIQLILKELLEQLARGYVASILWKDEVPDFSTCANLAKIVQALTRYTVIRDTHFREGLRFEPIHAIVANKTRLPAYRDPIPFS